MSEQDQVQLDQDQGQGDYSAFSDSEIAANPRPVPEFDDTPSYAEIGGQRIEFDDNDGSEPTQAAPPRRQRQIPEQQFDPEVEDPGSTNAAEPGDDGSDQDGPADPVFDDILLEAAGLDAEQAESRFGTPEALEEALRLMDERSISAISAQQPYYPQSNQQFQPRPRPPLQSQHAVQHDVAEDEEDTVDELVLPELPDGEEWDERTIGLAQTIADHFDSKLQQQKEQLLKQQEFINSYVEEQARRQLDEYVETFDTFIDSLGSEWKDTFGEGPGAEMDMASPEIQARAHLDTVSRQIEQGRAQQGLAPLSRPVLLRRALSVAFPKRQREIIRKDVQRQAVSRAGLATNRPGNTMRKQLSSDQKAISRAEKWYADRGATLFQEEEEFV